MPRKRVTVWVGISWVKAVRKAIWRGVVPEMGMSVHLSLPVRIKNVYRETKVRMLLSIAVISRNFANSLLVHARSRYLPPWKSVRPDRANVKTLFSTKVVVRRVHG